jgi:O-antigen/teichoic acid export membrane protein
MAGAESRVAALMEAGDQTQGGLGRHVAMGTLVQQAGQAVGLVAMLVMATALGRTLTLSEFGVYGLVSTFSAYLFFALGSAETAAVRGIAEALDEPARDRAFTTALIVYLAFGALAGLLVAGGGNLLIPVFDLSSKLEHQARLGALAVGALTASASRCGCSRTCCAARSASPPPGSPRPAATCCSR